MHPETDPAPVRLGDTALLRVAGVRCADWLRAGSPELFDEVADHALAGRARAERAAALAERLGTEVVPHPDLARPDRAAVLAVRRRLHTGAPPTAAHCALLHRLAAVPPALAAAADALHRAALTSATEAVRLDAALTAEQHRVNVLAWETARTHPALRALLEAANPELFDDVRRHLAAGEGWTDAWLRKRAGYLWRVLGRAAVKTTPRSWAGQVALVPVVARGGPQPPCAGGAPNRRAPGPAGGEPAGAGGTAHPVPSPVAGPKIEETTLLGPAGATLDGFAVGRTENVHLARADATLVDLRTAADTTRLVLAPLHVTEPDTGRLRVCVVDPQDPATLRQVLLRRTGVLDAVVDRFGQGPRELGEVRAAMLGPAPAPGALRGWEVLLGFLNHLLELGVLRICTPPRHRVTAWVPPHDGAGLRKLTAPRNGDAPDRWFLDVYRRTDATVGAGAAERVLRGLRTAARVIALREADASPERAGQQTFPLLAELGAITERPVPVSELLARRLAVAGSTPLPDPVVQRYGGWPPAENRDSGYGRLLRHLSDARDAAVVDLDDALLDAVGAPAAPPTFPPWPLDCLLRPLSGPGPVAVLETASAAGVLDARFADGLRGLHGAWPGAEGYRDFLAAVERRAGVRFVELLVPPMSARAANAVRRPVTTGWWTGDPDLTAYWPPETPGARYLPLDRITVRRAGQGLVAEADGQRIIPVHHATRVPTPPYDLLVQLLRAAGLPTSGWLIQLDGLSAALPHLSRLPRVSVGGDLVVSPATWRITQDDLWRPDDPLPEKVRTLALLRRAAGLPRHAFVRPASGGKPVPVDLAALPTLRTVERLCASARGHDLLVEEMLPAPDELPLRDAAQDGAAVAAQLLLRVPVAADVEACAAHTVASLFPGTDRRTAADRTPPDVPEAPAACGAPLGATIPH